MDPGPEVAMLSFRRRRALACSFCGKSDREVAKLIAGPGVHICDACVGLCNDVLAGLKRPKLEDWSALNVDELLHALPASAAQVEARRGVLQTQIDLLRKREVSWAAIGAALGISRQAAWERFS
jgi:hypothetical protein